MNSFTLRKTCVAAVAVVTTLVCAPVARAQEHPDVVVGFRNDARTIVALTDMDTSTPDCAQVMGPIKIQGVQFSETGTTVQLLRFVDKMGTLWAVPTNLNKLPNAQRNAANSFIHIGRTYYAHVQVCGSGGFASLIALYDMSTGFGA